jgi:hypothetical protein
LLLPGGKALVSTPAMDLTLDREEGIDALQLDLKSAAAAAKRFEAEAATNATFAEKNAKIVREIANDPKRPACRLSDADLKRVYAIR